MAGAQAKPCANEHDAAAQILPADVAQYSFAEDANGKGDDEGPNHENRMNAAVILMIFVFSVV